MNKSALVTDVCFIFELQGSDFKAHAPYFPKAKSEGWWMVLGDTDSGELLALKRIGNVRSSTRTSLSFYTPETEGRKIYTLYLLSDCYLGLDQQYDLYFEIVESNISSQFITEVTQ